MTVGAVNDAVNVSGNTRSLSSATMTGFSSWGPVDDGRIKPDIVANGAQLRSSIASGDSSYAQTIWSGTSMAYTFVYRSAKQTLTDKKVNKSHQKLIDFLCQNLGASLREG